MGDLPLTPNMMRAMYSRSYTKPKWWQDSYGDMHMGFLFSIYVTVVMFLFAAGVVGVMAINNHDTHVQCVRTSETTGFPTRTVGHFNPGCYIFTGGSWIPMDKWIANHPA